MISQRHHLGPATTTLTMRQVAELNEHLAAAPGRVTVDVLGLTGELAVEHHRDLPLVPRQHPSRIRLAAEGTLERVLLTGDPSEPYAWGVFRPPAASGEPVGHVITLHTPTLRRLSAVLGLRHAWGVDGVSAGSSLR